MAQGLRHSLRQEANVSLRVDPRVVLASQILQLTMAELEQTIDTELNENPALERLQDDTEPLSDETILRSVAPQELRPGSEDAEFRRSQPNDDQLDWLDFAPSLPSLHEHLRAQLLPVLPKSLRPLGGIMVESVNDKGYLDLGVEEIALLANRTLEEAELVLAQLQACEPAGVAARDLQECLLLQLRYPETLEQKLARSIVKSHLDEFIARRINRICRRYKVLPAVAEAAFEEIRCLTPFPGEGFSNGVTPSVRTPGVQPDLVLRHAETGWEIEVRGADPTSFTVNRVYRRRQEQAQKGARIDPAEKRHVATYVQRASDFIGCLQQRRRTLQRIGEYLLQSQTSFVSTGSYQFLRPLTRAQMARDLDLHESTVSRATAGKFVQIANGEVVSFEVFFKPALRVQKMIEEILRNEDPDHPLSDEAIAQMLAKKGVEVARRTVNKYRDRTKLLSSRKRRIA